MAQKGEDISARLAAAAIAVLLMALTLAVYLPVLSHDFINYDDPLYVTQNEHIRSGLTVETLWWSLTAVYEGNWLPLTWLTHMFDVSLYGLDAGGHHLTSLLIHLANVLLVFIVFRHMTEMPWQSAMLAALFAVHPLHVEPVAWVAQRKELLSTLFGLLALGAYLRYLDRPKTGRYLLTALFFAMSLAAKPMWMTFPVLLMLLDLWPLRRCTVTGMAAVRRLGILAVEKIPLFFLSLLSGIGALWTQHQGGAVRSLASFSLAERVGNALAAYAAYLGKTIWPVNLAVYYPHPEDALSFWKPAAAAVLLVLISVLVFRRFSRQPYLTVGWLWYLISFLPVIGLVQIGSQAMAGRYTYLPLTGIFIALVWGGGDFLRGFRRRSLLVGACALLLGLLVLGARIQLGYWKDSISLFERSLAVTGPNPVALINLGEAYEKKGRIDQAAERYRQAVTLSPRNPTALFNLAAVLQKTGRSKEAEALYRKTLAAAPGHAGAARNLAALLAEQGRSDEALKRYRQLLATGGAPAEVHGNMANLLAMMGRTQEALFHFQKSIALAPEDPVLRCNYAVFLEESGRIEEAIVQYAKAIRIDSTITTPYCRMARLLARRKLFEKAQTFVERARQHDPNACPDVK